MGKKTVLSKRWVDGGVSPNFMCVLELGWGGGWGGFGGGEGGLINVMLACVFWLSFSWLFILMLRTCKTLLMLRFATALGTCNTILMLRFATSLGTCNTLFILRFANFSWNLQDALDATLCNFSWNLEHALDATCLKNNMTPCKAYVDTTWITLNDRK